MDYTVSLNKVLISNALAIASRLVRDGEFKEIQEIAKQIEPVLLDNLTAQEYYGAAIKKLSFVLHNKKIIDNTPIKFQSVGLIENYLNSLILMARACLDSLTCVANLVYGDKLKETNVKPLEKEFLKTIHHTELRDILSSEEFQKRWKEADEYRNLIIHRSAIMIIPSGKELGKIDYFGVVKNPSIFLSSIGTKDAEKYLVKVSDKTDEISKLTMQSFIKLSTVMSQQGN